MSDLCPPKDMAKWFINRVDREAGEAITHLKLQKLLYFAQAYHLANRNVQLFDEDMQAWAHGPVVPSIWHAYKGSAFDAIAATNAPRMRPEVVPFLEAVYQKFGRLGAKQLENISHAHDPWKKTRGNLPAEAACDKPIDKKLIRDFYAKRIKKKWNGQIRTGDAGPA
jgi:uncharacterized phage-associated protein